MIRYVITMCQGSVKRKIFFLGGGNNEKMCLLSGGRGVLLVINILLWDKYK